MIEAFEIGISLALRDGVSDAIAAARRDVTALDSAIRSNAVSMAQLRSAGQRLLGKDPPLKTRRGFEAEPQAKAGAPEQPTRPTKAAGDAPAAASGNLAPGARATEKPDLRAERHERVPSPGISLPGRGAPARAQYPSFNATTPAAPTYGGARPPADGTDPAAKNVTAEQRTPQAAHIPPGSAPVITGIAAAAAPVTINISRPLPTLEMALPAFATYAQAPGVPDVIMRSITQLHDGQAAPHGPGLAPAETAGVQSQSATRLAPAATAPASGSPDLQLAAQSATNGDVFLDGALVGRWMCRFLARQAGRETAGPTGFDPRRNPILPGSTVGI